MDLFDDLDRNSLSSFPMKVELGEWYHAFSMDTIRKFEAAFYKVNELRKTDTIYPPTTHMYRAFRTLAPYKVKVVILGQDPYYNGQATGVAFACIDQLSPSLSAINDAMKRNHPNPSYYGKRKLNLDYLTEQGVLLLNTRLAVRKGSALSVNEVDWNELTQQVIKVLNDKHSNIVWMMWGRHAMEYSKYITNTSHLVLHCEHPAAAMRENRTWSCDHFRRANIFFEEIKEEIIHWT